MKTIGSTLMILLGILATVAGGQEKAAIKLPPAAHKGTMSVEEALAKRRTVRHFAARSLSLSQVSQLLWGTQGVTDPRGFRTAPSAGATYPLELYLVVGERGVENLAPGLYRYNPQAHALEPAAASGDLRQAVARASLHQGWMAEAPVIVIIAAEYRRCMARYGNRGIQYTHLEAGHAGQNLFLQAEAIGLACGIVGAFEDRTLSQLLKLPANHEPLLVMPVGYKF
jgi:SagB-type dehydrogenase family enzyme|uniref:SagB/ThcOx family dehydrogenase n=1 Tax=Desulfobacca acetoxidans TaxID=60893 RepID=A0A7C3SJ88_9BACT